VTVQVTLNAYTADALAGIPLTVWQQKWAPSPRAPANGVLALARSRAAAASAKVTDAVDWIATRILRAALA
jgi:hypothetical protein